MVYTILGWEYELVHNEPCLDEYLLWVTWWPHQNLFAIFFAYTRIGNERVSEVGLPKSADPFSLLFSPNPFSSLNDSTWGSFDGAHIKIKINTLMSKVRLWCGHRENLVNTTSKYIESTSNVEFKPFKLMYFMSDVYTCKILKVSNLFATKLSGQRNDKNWIYKTTYKLTYKIFISLTDWHCIK